VAHAYVGHSIHLLRQVLHQLGRYAISTAAVCIYRFRLRHDPAHHLHWKRQIRRSNPVLFLISQLADVAVCIPDPGHVEQDVNPGAEALETGIYGGERGAGISEVGLLEGEVWQGGESGREGEISRRRRGE
jgi:hypothetical protein